MPQCQKDFVYFMYSHSYNDDEIKDVNYTFRDEINPVIVTVITRPPSKSVFIITIIEFNSAPKISLYFQEQSLITKEYNKKN